MGNYMEQVIQSMAANYHKLRWKKESILSRIKQERCADHYGYMATLIGAINDCYIY